MSHGTAWLGIGAAVVIAAGARAEISGGNPAIVSPFDHAAVSIEWGPDTVNFPGFVRWADPEVANTWTNILEIPTARPGDHFVLPRVFSAAEELVLGYAGSSTGATEFSTATPGVEAYVQISAIDSMTYSVRAASVQPGSGTSNAIDHALFLVRFAQMPSPGASALAVAALVCVRRRGTR